MLSDWEKRSLASIEDELQRDRRLAAFLEGPAGAGGLRATLGRAFYPVGYLSCAVVFMIASVGISDGALVCSVLGGLGLWGFLAWRAYTARAPLRR